MGNQLVSIVIPAYNCEDTILKAVRAALGQSYGSVEVIVVDDGSVDRTAAIVRSLKEVKYIRQTNQGPAAARNKGAGEAKGGLIFFTDSDCIPERDWVKKMVPFFDEDADVAVVCGSYGISNNESMLARCIHKEILFRHKRLLPRYPRSFGSYNFGIRRDIFNRLGGFNTDYRYASGEDNDLSYKVLGAGYKILFVPDAVVLHHFPTSVVKYLREQFRHGVWRVKMYVDHPRMITGDDYTFWKDIVEIPVAFVFLLCFFLSFWIDSVFLSFCLCFFVVLFFLNFSFSFIMIKSFFDVIFFSYVMFVRSFARALGFSSGIVWFILTQGYKKIK